MKQITSFNNLKKTSWLIFLIISSIACDPMENLYKVIRKNGYIVFHTPLQHAGTGTLLGGTPKRLSIMAPPLTCFPDEINGEPTHLRVTDSTSLETRDYFTSMDFKLAIQYLKYMPVDAPEKIPEFIEIPGLGPLPIEIPMPQQQAGFANIPLPIENASRSDVNEAVEGENPPPQTIDLGIHYQKVKKVFMSFEGAEVEYLDTIALSRFYNNDMTEVCKDYLEHVGFITQALKVQKLKFSFQSESNGLIDLSLMNLGEIIQLDPRFEWKIVKKVYLEFSSPRYIGYQLGRLKRDDKGMALLRASDIKGDQFKFKPVGYFLPLE